MPRMTPLISWSRWTSDIDGELGAAAPTSSMIASFQALSSAQGCTGLSRRSATKRGFLVRTVWRFTKCATRAVWTSPAEGSVFADGDAVELSLTVSDLEVNPADLSLTWSSDIDGSISQQSAGSNGDATILATALSVGQHVLTVTAVDSQGLSTTAMRSITINGLPSAPSLTLTPNAPTTTDDVIISAQGGTDPEGETVSYTYFWYLGGNLSGASSSATLPATATTKGDTGRFTSTQMTRTVLVTLQPEFFNRQLPCGRNSGQYFSSNPDLMLR